MTLQVGGDVTEHSQASRSALFNALVEALKRDRKVGTITIQSEKCIRIPSKYNQILLNTIRILHQMASSTINYYQQRKQGKGSERWDDWMSAASVSSCSCFASGHTAASGSSHCGETRHKEKGLVQRFWNFEWEWNGHEWRGERFDQGNYAIRECRVVSADYLKIGHWNELMNSSGCMNGGSSPFFFVGFNPWKVWT